MAKQHQDKPEDQDAAGWKARASHHAPAKGKAADEGTDTTANPSPTAGDGGPPSGNRDDALEKSMGTRTADMGESGAARKDGSTPAAVDATAPAQTFKKSDPLNPKNGAVLWEGTIQGDALHGGAFRFRGSESEAEAKEAYLRHRGIRSTKGTVRVARVTE